MTPPQHPVTPDARYFVVRGKLWRMANPNLASAKKTALLNELMRARSAVRSAKLAGNQIEEAAAHRAVDVVKQALGERGPVWWSDGTPDLNRREMVFRLEGQPTPRRIFMRIPPQN
jgi:hypothetical protein